MRAGSRPPPAPPALAVTLHGVEPATFEHCTLIRDWLDDLGVDRVTLLVIPAADHHPFFQRSPALAEWLRERRFAGDAVGQQGFVHPSIPVRALQAPEHVRAGRRLMERAGLQPAGYSAPTRRHALGARRELRSHFSWWLAPGLWRAGTLLHKGATLRIDIHPTDFARSASRTRALERTLRTEAERREPVTYDQLASRNSRLRGEPARVARVP